MCRQKKNIVTLHLSLKGWGRRENMLKLRNKHLPEIKTEDERTTMEVWCLEKLTPCWEFLDNIQGWGIAESRQKSDGEKEEYVKTIWKNLRRSGNWSDIIDKTNSQFWITNKKTVPANRSYQEREVLNDLNSNSPHTFRLMLLQLSLRIRVKGNLV